MKDHFLFWLNKTLLNFRIELVENKGSAVSHLKQRLLGNCTFWSEMFGPKTFGPMAFEPRMFGPNLL